MLYVGISAVVPVVISSLIGNLSRVASLVVLGLSSG